MPREHGSRPSSLLGRRGERGVLDRQLALGRSGESSVLVLRGEPGIGKTALLDYVVANASGFRIARAVGVESEMELAFAGLHQLCAPMLAVLDRLPGPQRNALATAFGLSEGSAPGRFLVGLAVLSLLSEVGEEQSILCVVDDAQWLDRSSAQTLGFVARRLVAESVVLVIATRERRDDLSGLPELLVEGLPDREARALLGSVVTGRVDELVQARILAETRGNPLALIEMPTGSSPVELAGGFGLPPAPALSGRIEDSFTRRLGLLPNDTQRFLLVASAEPVGDLPLVVRAAERLGIGVDAAAAAESAGLIEIGPWLRFRHPLVRSAAYRAASPAERRIVHRALAEATDPVTDPDRRAWHRASAAAGPDEAVAAELEQSAVRARARGGLAAAAAFLQRASELTADTACRGERALAAARAKHEAGSSEAALALLPMVERGAVDERRRAEADVLRGQIAFAASRGGDAPPLLLAAAKRLEPLDPALARETYLEALYAAMFAGRLARGGGVREVAEAARAAAVTPAGRDARAVDLLLDGLATWTIDGYAVAVPLLRRALEAFRAPELAERDGLRWLWLAGRVALALWDDDSWHLLSARHIHVARDAGALTVLPLALAFGAGAPLYAGDFADAQAMAEEADEVSAAISHPGLNITRAIVAGWRGREAEASELIDAAARDAVARGEGRSIGGLGYATAVLYNGLGRYERALAAAQETLEHPEELWSGLVLHELVEAAVRLGARDRAAGASQRLTGAARASGTHWALGIDARSRALLADGDAAEALYTEAIDRLGRTRIRVELARAHLLYGEWLRRARRRVDAREELRIAYEMLDTMGAEGFADRAAGELLATGETVRKRAVSTLDELTSQERRIARMARDGASNQDIATQLFISRKTVEYHLHKVFTKLGIRTREELAPVLAEPGSAARD